MGRTLHLFGTDWCAMMAVSYTHLRDKGPVEGLVQKTYNAAYALLHDEVFYNLPSMNARDVYKRQEPGIPLFDYEDREGWIVYDPTSDPTWNIYDACLLYTSRCV